MELLISLEEALRDTPDAVDHLRREVREELKLSSAKNKEKDISELVWFLELVWSFMYSYDTVSRTSASLAAKMPGVFVCVELEELPQILVNEIHNRLVKEQADADAEGVRMAALSPEDQIKEIMEWPVPIHKSLP